MKQAYLLTGRPGVGKTTLIKEAVSVVEQSVGGFYTREIRKQGIRQGFEIVTLGGASAILASVDFHGPRRVSKYGVTVDNLDNVGVTALRRATKECDIVVVDEIGKMELFSPAFREAVLEALDSRKKLLGTIMLAPHPWADRIKQDPRVEVVMVSRANSQQVAKELVAWLKS
jgi:nucleoside-triphosphatase